MPVYFITGASRGIGIELVRQLSSDASTTVVAAARSTSTGLHALQTLQCSRNNIRIVPCDVSSESSIASLSEGLQATLDPDQKIDFLINNAAVVAGPETKGLSVTAAALYSNTQTNVLGPALIVAALEPFLATNALVVNMSSGIGSLALVSNGTISARVAAYSISKAALNMLSVHQAQELKGKARVICLDPGHVKTELGGEHAVVEIDDSVKGIIDVLNILKVGEQERIDREAGTARFFNFRGDQVPW